MNQKYIRHTRIINLRNKIEQGWTHQRLVRYCIERLKVSKGTALSYIDEAAEPYRKKYQKENKK